MRKTHINNIAHKPTRSTKTPTVTGIWFVLLCALFAQLAWGHGDVVPQAVDTSHLPQLKETLYVNPYKGNKDAIALGKSAYNQNCARCHGLGAVSGGVAPDLRKLENNDDGDDWYIERVREGVTRNNIPYMPGFQGILSQEAMWAIRAWLVTLKYEDD